MDVKRFIKCEFWKGIIEASAFLSMNLNGENLKMKGEFSHVRGFGRGSGACLKGPDELINNIICNAKDD